MMIDDDNSYDRWVDRIICSKDFEDCDRKDADDNCMVADECGRKCWFVRRCPLGKARGF